jgi:hypothetical protein
LHRKQVLDIDGRKIGDPNDPDTKRFQTALLKTETGTKIWNSLVASKRTYYFAIVGKGSNEQWKKEYAKTMGSTVNGITIAKKAVDEFRKGNKDVSTESTLNYNTKTGKHDITKEWDNTYIMINEDNANKTAIRNAAVAGAGEEEYDEYQELQFAYEAAHEGQHGLQTSFELYKSVYDPGTGTYKKGDMIPYRDDETGEFLREHEKNADYKGRQVLNELLKEKASLKFDSGPPKEKKIDK